MTLNAQARNIPVRVRKYHHSKEKGLQEEGKWEKKLKEKEKRRKLYDFLSNVLSLITLKLDSKKR